MVSIFTCVSSEKRFACERHWKEFNEFFKEVGFVQDKFTETFLRVDDFNKEAMGLYKELGYKEVGPIPDMYITGVFTYLMKKSREGQ